MIIYLFLRLWSENRCSFLRILFVNVLWKASSAVISDILLGAQRWQQYSRVNIHFTLLVWKVIRIQSDCCLGDVAILVMGLEKV